VIHRFCWYYSLFSTKKTAAAPRTARCTWAWRSQHSGRVGASPAGRLACRRRGIFGGLWLVAISVAAMVATRRKRGSAATLTPKTVPSHYIYVSSLRCHFIFLWFFIRFLSRLNKYINNYIYLYLLFYFNLIYVYLYLFVLHLYT
jgi:hypothetical protein